MDKCPICRENYDIRSVSIATNKQVENSILSNKVAYLSCKHHYHKRCIETWINKGHDNCPMCNIDITEIDIKSYQIAITDIETYQERYLLNNIDAVIWKVLARHGNQMTFDELLSETISELQKEYAWILFKYTQVSTIY